jgi:hypothetical protein
MTGLIQVGGCVIFSNNNLKKSSYCCDGFSMVVPLESFFLTMGLVGGCFTALLFAGAPRCILNASGA